MLADRWRRLNEFCDALFMAPWRASLARQVRAEEEVLLALLYLEALGVPGPANYAALELYPDLIESFHQWHRRQGVPRFPEGGVCC